MGYRALVHTRHPGFVSVTGGAGPETEMRGVASHIRKRRVCEAGRRDVDNDGARYQLGQSAPVRRSFGFYRRIRVLPEML